MAIDLGGLRRDYLGKVSGQRPDNGADHLQQAFGAASPQLVSQGIAEASRADQTPPFAQMVAQLFSQAYPRQQAGMLNQLLESLSPAALTALANRGALGGLLGKGGDQPVAITAQDAARLTAEQVQQVAGYAEERDARVIDQMSAFYTQHSGSV